MLVRLKPHNPNSGHVLQRYTYKGIKFESANGWYDVSDEVAAYLEKARSSEDPNAPLAFDVLSQDDAQALADEEFQAQVRAGAIAPNRLPPKVSPRDVDGFLARRGVGSDDLARRREQQARGGDMSTGDLGAGGTIGGRGARGGRASADTNTGLDQNHNRPLGQHATDRGDSETHATDPNPAPAPTGQSAAQPGAKAGTAENPIQTGESRPSRGPSQK